MTQKTLIKAIALKQIVNNGKWSLHRDLPLETIDDGLAESIARYGIITPPLLIYTAHNDSFEVVSGWRRIAAITSPPDRTVCCRILADTIEPKQLLERIVEEQQLSRKSSPVLKARLFLMSEALLQEKQQHLAFIGKLAMGAYQQLRANTRILTLDPVLLSAIHHGLLSEKTAGELCSVDWQEQQFIYQLCTELSLNHNRQRTFFEMSKIILGPNLTGLKQYFHTNLSPYTPPFEQVNLPQLTNRLFARLFALSHPGISAAKNEFDKLVRGLNLPEGYTLTASQSFEQDAVALHIDFKNLPAAEAYLRKLKTGGVI